MRRLGYLLYGGVAYLLFLATTLYAIGFVEGALVPRTVDAGGTASPLGIALLVDALLLALFAVQHSGMARRGFKRVWTNVVPGAVERSTYVLASSGCLLLLFYLWRPVPAVVWSVGGGAPRVLLFALSALGWGIALLSTFLISHFELFGLRQVYLAARRRRPPDLQFRTPLLYKLVRHPLYLGFIIAFWAAPTMTVGRLVFALAMLGYVLVGILLEERDLVREFGQTYLRYRERVRGLVPIPRIPWRLTRPPPESLEQLVARSFDEALAEFAREMGASPERERQPQPDGRPERPGSVFRVGVETVHERQRQARLGAPERAAEDLGQGVAAVDL